MRYNRHYLKWIAGTLIGLMVITSALMMKYKTNKIEQLEDQLYIKQQNEQMATDYYESVLNEKTIQSKFNTLQEYPVLKDCTINISAPVAQVQAICCGTNAYNKVTIEITDSEFNFTGENTTNLYLVHYSKEGTTYQYCSTTVTNTKVNSGDIITTSTISNYLSGKTAGHKINVTNN